MALLQVHLEQLQLSVHLGAVRGTPQPQLEDAARRESPVGEGQEDGIDRRPGRQRVGDAGGRGQGAGRGCQRTPGRIR